MSPPDPNQETYCPRLGHAVMLSYCVRESVELPCPLVYSCWEGRLPIHEHLLTMYAESQLASLRKPRSKLSAILDGINQARQAVS